jgi:peptidoglycan/LPS O-acetylase OafA/YrhL
MTSAAQEIGPSQQVSQADKRPAFVPEVESLRGIAALVVLLYHLVVTPAPEGNFFATATTDQLANFVLTTIFNGTGAVVLFFVISGFVLSCNVNSSRPLSASFYAKFAIRRVFRIMPAVWASLAFAIAILTLYYRQPIAIADLPNAMVLGDQATKLNPPLWSLRIEMAISAVFPFLLFANFKFGLAAQIALLAVFSFMTYNNNDPVWWRNFLFCFQLGIMAPGMGKLLFSVVGPRLARGIAILAIPGIMMPTNMSHLDYLTMTHHSLIEGFSSFVILSYILFAECPRLTSVLRSRPLRFVGRVSYSLYLLHYPFIGVIENTALQIYGPIDLAQHGTVFKLVLLPVVVPLSLALAYISYRVIEVPFHELGRRIAGRVGQGAAATGWKSLSGNIDSMGTRRLSPK